ncbi:hypothetical protein [Methylocystis echinoides]|uniref:Uncharacterized protein n=1 Tax=Methylocystis echinoides TaxID=29468 RepID=A0A9W6GW42_9HYPH|nr:hypothetical protein [Methylocystis echinoides]GLI93949.1 hypothetical protein LMG27198_29410 [Methylocystis echinoides]
MQPKIDVVELLERIIDASEAPRITATSIADEAIKELGADLPEEDRSRLHSELRSVAFFLLGRRWDNTEKGAEELMAEADALNRYANLKWPADTQR